MNDKDKLKIISRLISGYTLLRLNNKIIIVDTPDDALINESLFIYDCAIEDLKYEPILRNEHTYSLLLKNGIINNSYDMEQTALNDNLDARKEELYQSRHLPQSQLKKIRAQIQLIKDRINQQRQKRYSLDRYTIEGLAEYAAEQYLFSKLILNSDYNKIELSGVELDIVISKYKQNFQEFSSLREIARTEPWRSIWTTNPNCFRKIGEEQRLLMIFSKMYSNVYEHPECPSDYIINDDDMLDGWFIVQRKENQKNKADKQKDVLTQRHKNAGEIFLITNNPEEIKEIEDMNDARAKIIKERRRQQLQQQGYSKDNQILELMLEANNG